MQVPADGLARASIAKGVTTSALSTRMPTPSLAGAADSAAVLHGGGRPDLWAAAGWTSELHAELRASVRLHRTQTLVARAIEAACGSGSGARGEATARTFWAADSEESGGESAGAASRILYIGGGGLAVTEGDVLGIVEAATVRRGAGKALVRSVSVSRGWAFAEMLSAVEVSQLLCVPRPCPVVCPVQHFKSLLAIFLLSLRPGPPVGSRSYQ
jgi:hypothetical protein